MMEFTVLKTKVKISPLFFAVLTAFLITDRNGIAPVVIGFSLVHELCHFAALLVNLVNSANLRAYVL